MNTKTKLFLGHILWGLVVVVAVNAVVGVCVYAAVLTYLWLQ